MKPIKVEVVRAKVQDVFEIADKFVSKANLNTVLNFAYVEKTNNGVEITASDGTCSFTAPLAIDKWDGGENFLLPVTSFLKLIKDLAVDNINVDIDKGKVKIKGKNFKYSLSTLGEEADYVFLSPGDLLTKFYIPAKDLAYALNKVSFSASTNLSQRNINGVFINFLNDKTDFCGTDQSRLALKTIVNNIKAENKEQGIIVPISLINNVVPLLLSYDGNVTIEVYDNLIRFVLDNGYKLSSRKIDENYPSYDQVASLDMNDYEIIAGKNNILKVLKRIDKVLTDDKIISLNFENNILTISTSQVKGEAEETVDVINKQSFNTTKKCVITVLINALQSIGTDEVVFKMSEGDIKPIAFKEFQGDKNYIALIMPIRDQVSVV